MSDLQIVELDVFDPVAFDAWYAAYEEAELASGEDIGSPWKLEEMRAQMQLRGARSREHGYAGLVDGRVVTAGFLRLSLLDNTDRALVAVHTIPSHRRRGYGRAMLAHLEQAVREQGRSILVGEAAWAYDAGPDGTGVPAREFARSAGFDLALGEVKRMLDLPVADGVLDALAAEAAERHAGYTLRSWVGRVPDDLIDAWARLTAAVLTEAPTGDMDVEPEYGDAATVRDGEALIEAQGRTKYNSIAFDPAGEAVAYTDIATTIHEPGKAYQWGTLVQRDARGHRLGLALKIANLRLLQEERPDIRTVTTYNAEVNAHMIGVNEQLGFRKVARFGGFQKRLA